MRCLLGLLLTAFAGPALAQVPEMPTPAGLQTDNVDHAMRVLARDAIEQYADDDPARKFGTLFRLQLVAGQYAKAIDSIQALRKLRGPTAQQPPSFLQYEIHARAKQRQAQRGIEYSKAWRQVFSERFGILGDQAALQAEFSFRGALPRMREDLNAALAKATGRQRIPLPEAIDLVRAYQVHTAYAEFQPLFGPALEEDDARRYITDRRALVTTPDGARIAAMIVRPAAAPALPTLLQFTIYANDDLAWGDAKTMAAHGYVGAVAYSRGKGRSPDAIAPFLHDGADAAAVIGWIASQPWSDGRVGMFGGSYNSFVQWAALKYRPPALKAIATSASVAPGIDVPMEGNIFLNFMYPWPLYAASSRWLDDARYGDGERWARLDRDAYASGRAYTERPALDGSMNPVFAQWLRHPAYDHYWQAMIPQGEAYAAIDIPVLATTGYFDGGQAGVLHYLREHLRYRPHADHTLVIGPYEHVTMQTGVPSNVQGYVPDAVARINLQALRLAWFDHVLKGAPKPELLAGRVNWQAMGTDAWRHADTLDTMATRTQALCLAPGPSDTAYTLSTQRRAGVVARQRVDFGDRSDAGWTPPAQVINTRLDPQLGLVFMGEPVAQDTELAGPFGGVLDFTVNKHDVDLGIGIYELSAEGNYLELAWWLQRASYSRDRRQRHLLQPGVLQRLLVKDTRLIGRRLAAGSRLVVTLGVIKQPDRQLNVGSGKDPSEEVIADAGVPLEIQWYGSSCLDIGVRD